MLSTRTSTTFKTSELHSYDHTAAKVENVSTPDGYVPAHKMKSMSDLDKEEEARMAKAFKAKVGKGIVGWWDWAQKKIKGDLW